MVTVSDVVLKLYDQVFKRPWQNRASATEAVHCPYSGQVVMLMFKVRICFLCRVPHQPLFAHLL